MHDVSYSDSKYRAKRSVSGNILKDRAYQIGINPKYNGYQEELASIVSTYFDKETWTGMKKKKNVN